MADGDRIVEIEAFRAEGKAARGITTAQLDEAVASYNSESNPAPLVFGHPKSNDPAHGVIATAKRVGKSLLLGLKNISEEALNGVKAKRFINRSIAFWHPDHTANPTPGKWNIRHIGLLGAASPGIPGMKPLTFSADEEKIESELAPFQAVIFNDQKVSDETTQAIAKAATDAVIASLSDFTAAILKGAKPVADDNKGETVAKTEFDALQAKASRLEAEAADRAKADEKARKEGNTAFVAEMIEQGRVTPGDKDFFVELLNRLPTEEVTFSADDKDTLGNRMRKLLSDAEPRVVFSVISPKGEKGKSDEDPQVISDKAVAFQAEQQKLGRTISAAEAVAHVINKGA